MPSRTGRRSPHHEPDSEKLRDERRRSLDLTDGQAFPEDFFASAACEIVYHTILDGILGKSSAPA